MSEQILNNILEKLVEMDSDIKNIKDEVQEVKSSQVRMENDLGIKVTSLFDGYTLRGDQLEQLQEHLDERLDSIQNDLSYVVGKVAQHDRNIVQLNKRAK